MDPAAKETPPGWYQGLQLGVIIAGRILHIEPEHGVCRRGKEKQQVQRRVYTGPGLAAYELELRNPTVTMVNIKNTIQDFWKETGFFLL